MRNQSIEIILITYNRKKHLQNTFNQIFAEESPIKDFPITILDNKSTDGTSELIEEYRIKFPNIKHIINNRNIGGNANIARAFEIASKEYVWILCDDDEYDFTHWKDVEKAIEENYDAIVIGGGHAGAESALALARLGKKTLMLTISLDAIGFLPCNPSIGGTAKGHLVCEIDALGGEMGVCADKSAIQIRM